MLFRALCHRRRLAHCFCALHCDLSLASFDQFRSRFICQAAFGHPAREPVRYLDSDRHLWSHGPDSHHSQRYCHPDRRLQID